MIALSRCDTVACDAGPWPKCQELHYTRHIAKCSAETVAATEEVVEAEKLVVAAKAKLKRKQVKIVIT